MIERQATDSFLQLAKWYPVVAVVGPRQSGKTTLMRTAFPHHEYVNLEDKNTRDLANQDPSGFLKSFSGKVIFDEAQNCPDLFSQIQIESDANEIQGKYIISGSRNLALAKNIRQSLAGRVGILTLLPLSMQELKKHDVNYSTDEAMLKGGFPRLFNSEIETKNFYRNYMATYIDRDVRIDMRQTSLQDYRNLVRLCATNTGNLINYSNISKELGVARQTVKSWMSLLFQSYVCFELPAFYANERKILTKTPKLYFYDTGLLCFLLRIYDEKTLLRSKHLGKIFENFVVVEALKQRTNLDEQSDFYFYRDDSKREIDFIDASDPENLKITEIKSTSTFKTELLSTLKTVGDQLNVGNDNRSLVMRTDKNYLIDGIHINNLDGWLKTF